MNYGRMLHMTVKKQLIELLRRNGYDFFTAAEEATAAIKEFKASKHKKMLYYVQGSKEAFELRKKELRNE